MEDMIFDFIKHFHIVNGEVVDRVFTEGCCYWFALILRERFSWFDAKIVYDEIENHFATDIMGRVYDVTGDVTEGHEWVEWEKYDDVLRKERIIEQCVMF